MPQVEIDVRMPRLRHLGDDRPADDVARGEFGPRVVVGHEAVAVAIDEPGPRPANRLGDQIAARAGDVEHSGMELHELHVAQLGAGAIGDRQAVAGGHLRVRRFAVHLPDAAGAEDRLLRPDERLAVDGVPDERPAAMPVVRQEIERERVGPGLDVREPLGPGDHRPHHFLAGCVAQGMNDAMMAVSPFAAQRERAGFEIEMRAPADQLMDAVGRFADHHFDDRRIAKLAAGRERVGDVVFKAVFRVDNAGDASLGELAVRFLEVVLGDHEDRELRIDGDRRPQPGQPAADDQHVGERMRYPLGMERDEIAGSVGHRGSRIRENSERLTQATEFSRIPLRAHRPPLAAPCWKALNRS